MLRTHFSVFFTAFLIYSAFIIGAGIHFSLAPYGFWFIISAASLFFLYCVFAANYYSEKEYYAMEEKLPDDMWVKPNGAYILSSLASYLVLLVSISAILGPMVVEKLNPDLNIAWYYYVLLLFAALYIQLIFVPVVYNRIGAGKHLKGLNNRRQNILRAKKIVDKVLVDVLGVDPHEIMPYALVENDLGCDEMDIIHILIKYENAIPPHHKKNIGLFVEDTKISRDLRALNNGSEKESRNRFDSMFLDCYPTVEDHYYFMADVIEYYEKP